MNTMIRRRGAMAATAAAAVAAVALGPASAVMAHGAPRPVMTAAAYGIQPLPTGPAVYEFGETLARLEGRSLEITFFASIIPHHQHAIHMAELELERGVDPQIRTHADNIIADQRHQIEQFTRWLREWYGLTPQQALKQVPAEARREIARMEQEAERMMAALRRVPSGPRLDIAFVRAMIPHHTGGIVEFLEPQARAIHPQLRVAATAGINTQEREIADFRTWLSEQGDSR